MWRNIRYNLRYLSTKNASYSPKKTFRRPRGEDGTGSRGEKLTHDGSVDVVAAAHDPGAFTEAIDDLPELVGTIEPGKFEFDDRDGCHEVDTSSCIDDEDQVVVRTKYPRVATDGCIGTQIDGRKLRLDVI